MAKHLGKKIEELSDFLHRIKHVNIKNNIKSIENMKYGTSTDYEEHQV